MATADAVAPQLVSARCNWAGREVVLSRMREKPDLQTVMTCLSRLEGQIADQRRLVDVLRELGDVPEAEKAALRLTSLEESFDAVFLYRKLLEEEMNQQKRLH